MKALLPVTNLIDEKTLHARIEDLGATIATDFQGQEIVLICILKGSFLFMADLARAIFHAQVRLGTPLPQVWCDFMAVRSYGDQTVSSGIVQITADLTRPVEGKHVIIVEDIVDTGLTMSYLMQNIKTRNPASIKVCTLLHKPSRMLKEVPLDYVGFTVKDLFVVGYGLDYQQGYRHLPFIGVLQLDEKPLAKPVL